MANEILTTIPTDETKAESGPDAKPLITPVVPKPPEKLILQEDAKPMEGANVILARNPQTKEHYEPLNEGIAVVGMVQFDIPTEAQQKAGFIVEENAADLISQFYPRYKYLVNKGEIK